MFSHETKIRVRYAETDQMGYVYYGHYPTYYEVGRVEAFRFLGFPYRELEEKGMMMPVFDLYTRYIQPARYDDLLTIQVSIKELPAARIIFEYEIRNELQTLLNTGKTTLVFIEKETQKLRRCPAELLDLLKPYFE